MSRRRRQSPPQPVAGKSDSAGSVRFRVFPILTAIILAGVPFVLGKYSEFNSPDPFDSGAYVYSAKHVLDGAKLGVDEIASAQPGTLMVNVIGVGLFGYNETGPKLIQTILQLAAFAIMFCAVFRLFGPLAAVVSVTVASFFLSAPVIAKFGNVKEQYMIAFMIFAASGFVFYQLSGKWYWAMVCGGALINVYYFKPTGVSVAIALVVFLFFQKLFGRRNLPFLFGDICLLLAGALVGIAPLAVFFLLLGQFDVLSDTMPFVALELGIILVAVIAFFWYLAHFAGRFQIIAQLRRVRRWIWAAGLISALVLSGSYIVYFAVTDRGDAVSYIKDITFIKYPLALYGRIYGVFDKFLGFLNFSSGYIADSYRVVVFKELLLQITRYYMVLILPVALACSSILVKIIRCFIRKKTAQPSQAEKAEALVLFFAVWWLLDMAMVWVSPHSYEQYYLPLNASAAMLGGYILWLYWQRLAHAADKLLWLIAGAAVCFFMIMAAEPVFFGLSKSPDTGRIYQSRDDRRGYVQKMASITRYRRGRSLYPWEAVGEYIRQNSSNSDPIYVWGWYPGIYVRAQRLSCVPRAFESNMHLITPAQLDREVNSILNAFSKHPPRFIVDSRKRHFPWDRFPFELWPVIPKGFMGNKEDTLLPLDAQTIAAFDIAYSKMLSDRFGEDEAKRYNAMAPFRKYVMENYRPMNRNFLPHILFERKLINAEKQQ